MSVYDLSDEEPSRSVRNCQSQPWAYNGRHSVMSPIPQSSAASVMISTTLYDSHAQSVGLSDPRLAEDRRRKLNAINKLSSLGTQRDVDLPQIVVIGSQSAGKSSLIESISGITLPRASGTCTRCPMECRLIHSNEPWQCTILLKLMIDASGRPLDIVKNIQFGAPIRERKQVEDRLRRAQQAILNPATEPEEFLQSNLVPRNNALAFSANCVSLEIIGPDVTDLSFVDLPGLISSVGDGGRDSDVEEVKDLVSSYISKPSCIILLTVACESDFETQGAYRLAKQHDKDGVRTIGVLTKPDRIPDGEEARWIQLIKNEKAALHHGWYCVKQPSSKELDTGLAFQEARRRGEEFFAKKPWSKLPATFQKQLGTNALTIKLNDFLMATISKKIPEIVQELQRILQQTKEELQDLPKLSALDPVMELMHLIGEFSDELYRQAEGFNNDPLETPDSSSSKNNYFQLIDKENANFRRIIRETAPNFRPFCRQEPTAPSELGNLVHALAVAAPQGNAEYEPSFLQSEEDETICSSQDVIYRDDVVQRVKNATTRELPGYYPFQVVQSLVSCSTDQWSDPALCLIHEVHEIVVGHQNKLIDKYFARFTEGGLHHTVSYIMHRYMQERLDECIKRVEWLLELEAHAFVNNKPYFNYYRGNFLTFYKCRRLRSVYPNKAEESLSWDPNQSAIEIMATVRAYFHVAYKRVVDTIPMAIDQELVRVRKRGVQEALATGLKITGPDGPTNCRRLLAEPASLVARREELENRLQRLGAAQRELQGI